MSADLRSFSRGRVLWVAPLIAAMLSCSSDATQSPCPEGTHTCGGACVEDTSATACGVACAVCPSDANGDAVCTNGACGLACRSGTLLCNGACAVCPGSTGKQAVRCEGSACVAACAVDFEPCASGCCPVDHSVVFRNSGAVSPSIAVDSKQTPHISFMADHYTLMYAHRDSGPWQVSTIDAKDGNANYSASIAIAADDSPIVAYTSNYSVRVARPAGSAWKHETVYQNARGYGPAIAGRALALDRGGNPHIVASQVYNQSGTYNSYLLHIFWDGTAWTSEHIQDINSNRYSEPALAIDERDVLHVTWVSYYDGVVNYATNPDKKWTVTAALKNGTCCDTSFVALNSASEPFISFATKTGPFAAAHRKMGTWTTDVLHADQSGVGNLAFAATGGLFYVVRDRAKQLLLGRPAASSWQESVVSPEAQQFLLAVDRSERAHVVWTTAEALKYLRQSRD